MAWLDTREPLELHISRRFRFQHEGNLRYCVVEVDLTTPVSARDSDGIRKEFLKREGYITQQIRGWRSDLRSIDIQMHDRPIPYSPWSSPLPNPGTPDPRLHHKPFIIQHHEIGPPPHLQLAPVPVPHHPRNILRHAPHRPRQLAPTPPPQIPHTLIQPNTTPDQRFRALDDHFVPSLALPVCDLRVAWVHAVRQTGELDAVCYEDASRGVGAEGRCQNGGVQVDAVGDERVVRRLRGGDAARETGVAVVERGHGIEDVR